MSRPVPTNVIIEMNKRGFSDFDIIRYLRGKGYTPVEINDAMNHAKVKMELTRSVAEEKEEILETKEKQGFSGRQKSDGFFSEPSIYEPKIETQEKSEKPVITELQFKQFISIISSKLKTIEERNKFQERAIEEVKEQIPRIMQQQISSVKSLNADVQALQQTFSKILEPLAHNVKVMSGMLDMPKEVEKAKKVEKEIKKEEKEVKKIKIKTSKKPKKVIKKTVTITETKPALIEKPKKVKKSKKSKEKIEKSKIIKTTVTKTEVKKTKQEPSLDNLF